ncbi:helix-turn-helix domain-containing protein [Paenibacillus sp. NPDC058071]|uniref:helix-turn-helix domain-containing protein n=1 Tax=Paenibacillus sp. NPDC058071 TaxID=3346326 RepID=UPI0036DE8BFA
MYPEMYHEKVVYQNPLLALRAWRIDGNDSAPDHIREQTEASWHSKNYAKWHYHKEVEFLLVIQGQMTAFCPDERLELKEGDVAIFGSNEPHTTLPTGGRLSYYVFQIDIKQYWDPSSMNSMRRFSEVIRPLSSLNYIYRENEEIKEATAKLIRDIYREMQQAEDGCDLAVSSSFKTMLLMLLRHDSRSMLHDSDNLLLHRFQPALDYIEASLGDKVSVETLSRLSNMSYTYFIKQFKQALGMSFTEFLAFRRVKRAEQLLLTSRLSIAEIAETVGISNIGHFYRMFRRINGCTPRQYLDRLQEPFSQ